MLMLARRTQERIFIGDSVVLTVLSVAGDYVRLGFEAPRSVKINREEVAAERKGSGLGPQSSDKKSGSQNG